MARLPQFQEQGLISANIPQLDFATGGQQALAREQARYSESVTSALDKMSQFAFGKAKEEQELRNKVVGIQLRSDLEGQVQNELNKLMVQVETGQLSDFDAIQDRVRALSGMAVGLAQVSPEQANGLMASINAGGKALLAKSSDILVKAYGAERDRQTDETIAAIQKNLETVYSVPDQLSPEDTKRYESASRAIVMSMAANNPTSMPEKQKAFESARVAARNTVLTNHFVSTEFAKSPSERLSKLRSGEVGIYKPLWDEMNESEKNKVIQTTITRYADDLKLIDQNNKLEDGLNKDANMADYESYYAGKIGGDELKIRLKARGYTFSREELRAIQEGDIPDANPQLYGTLESQAERGLLSEDDTERMAKENRISWKQRNNLNKTIRGAEDKGVIEAKSIIRNAFVPNPLDPMTRQSHTRRAEVENQLINERIAAMEAGKPFDAQARARELVDQRLKQADMQQLNDAKERLAKLLGDVGLNPDRTDWTDEDLKRAGVSNADKRKSILRQVRVIKDKQ